MRQVGILAAAGLYALKNNISRLPEDHEKAWILAGTINEISSLEIDLDSVQTNILMFKPLKLSVEESREKCKEKGLMVSLGSLGYLRAVTHLDISFEDIEKAKLILMEVFE